MCHLHYFNIHGLCIVSQMKEAVDLFNKMVLENINPDIYTFNILIDGLCKEGSMREVNHVWL